MFASSYEYHRRKHSLSPRRRCWTEICRKIDGEVRIEKNKKDKKTKEEPVTIQDMHAIYTSTCFGLFILPKED